MGKLTATSPTRWYGIMAGLGLVLTVWGATWAQQPPGGNPVVPPAPPPTVIPNEPRNAAHSARARLELARKALETIQQLNAKGEYGGKQELDHVYRWSRRAVEAQKDIGGKKADQIAAIEDHLARMKKSEDITNTLFRGGEVDMLEVMETEFRRIEAESWLAEAIANK